jgi:hypothetical protein
MSPTSYQAAPPRKSNISARLHAVKREMVNVASAFPRQDLQALGAIRERFLFVPVGLFLVSVSQR